MGRPKPPQTPLRRHSRASRGAVADHVAIGGILPGGLLEQALILDGLSQVIQGVQVNVVGLGDEQPLVDVDHILHIWGGYGGFLCRSAVIRGALGIGGIPERPVFLRRTETVGSSSLWPAQPVRSSTDSSKRTNNGFMLFGSLPSAGLSRCIIGTRPGSPPQRWPLWAASTNRTAPPR